jgi:hypothetical protein
MMADVPGIDGGSGLGPLEPGNRQNTTPARAAAPSPLADSVEISQRARLLDEIARLPEIRQDKVQAARDALRQGTLDTPERLDTALDVLLDEILGGSGK